jgi:hypothetical protein
MRFAVHITERNAAFELNPLSPTMNENGGRTKSSPIAVFRNLINHIDCSGKRISRMNLQLAREHELRTNTLEQAPEPFAMSWCRPIPMCNLLASPRLHWE